MGNSDNFYDKAAHDESVKACEDFDRAVDRHVGAVERVRDPEHFDKLFLALMVRRMQDKRGNLEEYPAEIRGIDNVLARLDAYNVSGNTAHLVDAANFIWIEFMRPSHPAHHFAPLQEDQTPERIRVADWKITEIHERGES